MSNSHPQYRHLFLICGFIDIFLDVDTVLSWVNNASELKDLFLLLMIPRTLADHFFLKLY